MTSHEFFLDSPAFSTRDFAQATGMRPDSASRFLKAQAGRGTIVAVTRGVWANPKHPSFSAYRLVPYLLGNEQGYVSLISALHRHGVISQIPQAITVATTGHSRRVRWAGGEFRLVQLNPRYVRLGVEWQEGYGMATAEKALLDALYVSTRKGRGFSHFPELELGHVDLRGFERLLAAHRFPKRIDAAIRTRFARLTGQERP